MSRRALRRTLRASALAALVAGCGGGGHPGPAPAGDRQRGHDLIVRFGCGACHRIGGVDGADGTVGPTLQQFKSKRYIAGQLSNTPANAVRWIRDPRRISPQTAMPALGLSRQQAQDVVSYLYGQ